MKSLLRKTAPALQLFLVYIVFSTAWILAGDEIVTRLNYSPEATERLQNLKGLLFVFSSALLLYFISHRLYRNLRASLKEKEALVQKLTAFNEASKEGIVDYDFSTDTAVVNEEMLAYLETDNYRVENFTSRHHAQIHPDDRTRVVENFTAFLKQEHSIWQAAYRYRNRKGAYREVMGRGYLLRQPETGEPLHFMYALQDITALKDANTKYYRQQLQHRQQMAQSILTAQETERNRWALEMHDNVCQVLTAAKLYLEQAVAEKGSTQMLAKSQAMMEKAINDIRQLSALIKPPEFSNTSLSDSIENLLANLQRFSKAEFDLHLQAGIEQRLREEQKIMVYRIVQEQLNNILKYAEATYVKVAVNFENDAASVTVQDNGKGFDPQAVKAGIGLKNMRDRLQIFGGQLSVVSSPAQGCEVKAVFSLS